MDLTSENTTAALIESFAETDVWQCSEDGRRSTTPSRRAGTV
jgi:hypothetical protein